MHCSISKKSGYLYNIRASLKLAGNNEISRAVTASFSLLPTFIVILWPIETTSSIRATSLWACRTLLKRGRSLYCITQHLLNLGFLCQRCASRTAFTKRQNIADREVCQAENVTFAVIGFASLVVFP